MAALKEKGIALLGSATLNMQNGSGAQTIFTVPNGKFARITHIVIRDNTATLAGGTSYAFTNWRSVIDLSGMTTANTIYRVLNATDNTNFTETAGGVAFQMTPTTGSTGAANATIDVFGYLSN